MSTAVVRLISLGILSATLGSAQLVWADCKNVKTADFAGQVCSYSNGNETRSGRWIMDEGAAFNGSGSIATAADGSQRTQKAGYFSRAGNDWGKMSYEEAKSATGTVTMNHYLAGREVLSSGGVFEGTNTLTVTADGSQRIEKRGKIRSAAFDGDLFHFESKSPTGVRTMNQQLTGREVMDGGGLFEGVKSLVINADGSQRIEKRGRIRSAAFEGDLNYSETKSSTGQRTISQQLKGQWTIAPDYKLAGSYAITWNPDGTKTVSDTRTRM